MDFYDAKGAVEALLGALGICNASFVLAEHSALHPRASAQVRTAGGTPLGFLGELHPRAIKRMDLPLTLFAFELNVDGLIAAAGLVPEYRAVNRFPAVLRDVAVVVPIGQRNDEVRKVILEVGGALVEDAQLFDVYTGKPLPEGRKNLAYALRYRSAERTLRDDEVNEAHGRIVAEVNHRLGGQLRGSNPE